MTSKKMWFGTKEKMTWINCPAFNAPTSPVGWSVGGTLLNGGAWSRSSKTSHREYDFNWNLASAEDIYKVQDYASGLYGDGPFYFVMPGTESNILPEYYANPAMAAGPSDEVWRLKRKNLVSNPSFETGTAGWVAGDSVTVARIQGPNAIVSGRYGLSIQGNSAGITTNGARIYLPGEMMTVTPGQYVAVSTALRYGNTGSRYAVLGLDWYAATWIGSSNGRPTAVSSSPLDNPASRLVHVAGPAPAGTSRVYLSAYFRGASESVAPSPGFVSHNDAWIAVAADTEAEALAAVQVYFDGDTPDTPTRRYVWDGTPHASTSSEYELVASAAGPGDSPSLVKGQTPISVPTNSTNATLPVRGVQYTLSPGYEPVEFFVPGIPGETLYFRSWGRRSNSSVGFIINGVFDPLDSPGGRASPTMTIPPEGAHIKLTGTGVATIYGMRVSTDPSNEWKPGRGHSGCAMEGKPQITTYSAGLDLMGMSAKFVEVGAWL